MPQRPLPRRGYDDPPRTSAGGHVFVLILGLLLMFASGAGGAYLVWKNRTAAGASGVTIVDLKVVCADLTGYTKEYPDRLEAALKEAVDLMAKGDETGFDKITSLGDEYASKLKEQSARTDNADLKKAIGDLVAAIEAEPTDGGIDAERLNAAQAEEDRATAAIAEICA